MAALIPLFLAACGGGGGGNPPPPPPPQTALVYGTAATGHALSGTVVIEDAAGHTTTLPITGSSGSFSASVTGMTAPFMLKASSADGTTVLYSAVAEPGLANVTPLTSLALLRVAAQRHLAGPADLYAAPAAFASWLNTPNLAGASAAMLSRLMPAFVAALPGASASAGSAPTYDPIGSPWTVGTGVDLQLDAWPVTFSTDATGVVTATQSEKASGVSIDVARSDTAATPVTGLSVAAVGNGTVVGGTSTRLGAQATFQGGAVQPVAASWAVSGLDRASVDANGNLALPAVDVATPFTVSATWFDGSSSVHASTSLTALPAMRPLGLSIGGAAPGASITPASSLALGATVQWSDGSTSTPVVTWAWSGDASAVAQLGSDGLLRAGRPAADSPIHVTATFSQGGVAVSADIALTVARFVRRVQSVSLTGLASGQVLTAGDQADLALTALWNDGSESTLAPRWTWSGNGSVIPFSVSSAGHLATSSYFVADTADTAARSPVPETVTASYDNGDGTSGSTTVAFAIKPLLKIPTALHIFGAVSLAENTSTSYNVTVTYSDGSTENTDATFSTQQPTLLVANGAFPNSFTAGLYASKPATPQIATLVATRTFAYVDANGNAVSPTLTASIDVSVTWVEPTLTALAFTADHLGVGVSTPIPVTGYFHKFAQFSTQTLDAATFASSSALVTTRGSSVTAVQAPATAADSWITLTATAIDPSTGQAVSLAHRATVDLPGSVAKRLLPYAYGPLDPEVQFRAISSDGHVDDYTVARSGARMLGYESPATRRRLPLISGATDFAQTRIGAYTAAGDAAATFYIAAVEHGNVVLIRHDDLYNAASQAMPVMLPGVANARAVALVTRNDPLPSNAAVRLYVLDGAGSVRQYKLPYQATAALVASDIRLERQLPGTWSQISGGADFVLLLSTAGAAYAEGSASAPLADPAFGAHWNDTFAMQQGFTCQPDCSTFAPLTGVSQVHAGLQLSVVALTDGSYDLGSSYTSVLQWSGASATFGPAVTVRAQAVDAWIDGAGKVVFLNLAFAEDEVGGPGVINIGSTRVALAATWLPAASEIVDGRRNVVAAWPWTQNESNISPLMPILRTTTDALYYLDGRAILDPQGHPVVLP